MRSLLFVALLGFAAARAPFVHTGDVIPGEYIVQLKKTATVETRDALLSKLAGEVSTMEVMNMYSMEGFTGFAARMPFLAMNDLLDNEDVALIEANQVVSISESEETQTDVPSWGLNRVSQRDMDLDGRFIYDSKAGENTDVYIIDTGIYVEHNDFKGRAVLGFWPPNDPIHDDCNGHGTHVAGTAAGTLYGLAKKANLISVKVLGCFGSGTTANVIAGVDYVTAQHKLSGRNSVANMSLGGPASAAMDGAVAASVDAGVVQVVAAGNSNNDACTASPAREPKAFSVGSTDIGASNTDVRSSFSSYGPCTDIWAPGSGIQSAWIGAPDAERTISGTSMAAPHVCGAVALYYTKYGAGTPAAVERAVTSQATSNKINLNCPSTGTCNQSPNLMLYSRL